MKELKPKGREILTGPRGGEIPVKTLKTKESKAKSPMVGDKKKLVTPTIKIKRKPVIPVQNKNAAVRKVAKIWKQQVDNRIKPLRISVHSPEDCIAPHLGSLLGVCFLNALLEQPNGLLHLCFLFYHLRHLR